MDHNILPEMLRVDEAARFLRIGRNRAYEEAARFLASHGQAGLPCIRIGRTIRVPRRALESWIARQLEPESDADATSGAVDAA